jgi:hypothetical protein
MAAAFAAERRGEATLARHYADAALDAERASTIPRPYRFDLAATRWFIEGMIASIAGAWDDMAAAWLESAEQFRRRDNLHMAASSLSSAAAALCYGGRFADAVPHAANAVTLARAQGQPLTRVVSLASLAMAVSPQDANRARELLDEAAQFDPAVYNYGIALQLTLAAARIDDWPLAAHFAAPSIPLLHWVNHRPYLNAAFTVVARILAEHDPEAAATIQGAAHTLRAPLAPTNAAAEAPTVSTPRAPASDGDFLADIRRSTTKLLAQMLGNEHVRVLREQAAAMDIDTAVAYTLTHLDHYLAHLDHYLAHTDE